MSNSTLTRFFKKNMGQTISNYINQVRIGKVCSLLIRTDRPIDIIIQSCGFNNQSNFNRLFKKYKFISPKDFRYKYKRK
ncbi:helix-turn-helix domain-containing protein [Paraphotobacterium marinum]|uniref:helix-turn-helix domain-containing protein n=1 Tax=Paraphotobacterium marinum TaxID=1755811 RepID=UPI0021F37231|nr:helix-turn-helix transcriptional regulator [Paraphotobacterium marinum]